jgi:hypothetical protein
MQTTCNYNNYTILHVWTYFVYNKITEMNEGLTRDSPNILEI